MHSTKLFVKNFKLEIVNHKEKSKCETLTLNGIAC